MLWASEIQPYLAVSQLNVLKILKAQPNKDKNFQLQPVKRGVTSGCSIIHQFSSPS